MVEVFCLLTGHQLMAQRAIMINRRELLHAAGAAAIGTMAGLYIGSHKPLDLSRFGYIRDEQAITQFQTRDRFAASSWDGDIKDASKGKVVRLWKVYEKLSGEPFTPHKQEIGDCTSQAIAVGLETQSAVRAEYDDELEWCGKLSTEALYIAARIEVGKGRFGWNEGSTGVDIVTAATDFGTLTRRDYGNGFDVSTYNPELAKRLASCWKFRPGEGVPKALEPLMLEQPLRRAVRIDGGFDQAADFVASGYPVLLCSKVGYQTVTDSDGFLLRGFKPWPHALLLWGIDRKSKREAGNIINSWGDGWYARTDWHAQGTPAGSFWADRDNIDSMLASNDCYAIIQYEGPKRYKIQE